MKCEIIKDELLKIGNSKNVDLLLKFFKAFEGGYGEGDLFIGLNVPNQRKLAKKYFKEISLEETESLLHDKYHECRLTALFILINKYQTLKNNNDRKIIFDLYLRNTKYINNWDLVDASADKILGHYLFDRDKSILYNLSKSTSLWEQRISIIATFYFIRNKRFEETLEIAKILLNHKHDLIHKAVGWMLREIGNRDFKTEYDFLKQHYKDMPRTMLRYSIEKFNEPIRQSFLKSLE